VTDAAAFAGTGDLAGATARVAEAVRRAAAGGRPYSGADPAALAAAIAGLDPCPEDGVAFDAVLAEVESTVLAHGVALHHPRCAAHLHAPTLLASAAAELAIGATNQSMDSFEGAPAATYVEDHLVRWLARLLGFADGSGVVTSGGTASNLLGLFLARERAPGPIVTSVAAHDSIARSARLLGLAVVAVAVDRAGRIDLDALDAALAAHRPSAIVATAGTTDLGAIDPLDAVAERARDAGAWLHVDAAVGSALALSDRLAPLLGGIAGADSITADLHKLWFQPIGASALLVPSAEALRAAHHHSDYLNRPEDEERGVLNLVGRSLDTSRRFDALKVLVGLRCVGRRRMAAMVEHLVDLAAWTAAAVDAHPELELLAPPSTVTVVFRWAGGGDLDAANARAQRELLASGEAVVGRTRLGGRVALKLTLVNPLAGEDDVRGLLDLIAATARGGAA
jgi:L-2,4-diaminobutyrate decarboxylase